MEPAGPEHAHALSADIDKPDPVDPEDLVAQHLPAGFPRPVRQKLITATAELLGDGLDPATIGAALKLWTHREGAAPGLLPYLAADVQLDDLQPKKPTLGVNGSAPPWCGDCDETSRWHEGDTGWYRCPKCHPLATPTDTTDDPWTPPTALTFDAADVPPF